MSTNDQSNNAPVATKRYGRINAAIFEQSGKNEQGESSTFYRTSFTRTYTDREGRPQSSTSFSDADLLKVKELAGWAFNRSQELRQQATQSQQDRGDAFDRAEGQSQHQGLSR